MLRYYLALGLTPAASDEEIRKRYLALIKQNPPERDAVRFQEISTAYEKLKDEATRIRTRVLDPYRNNDPEEALADLVHSARPGRVRQGLQDLLAALPNKKRINRYFP